MSDLLPFLQQLFGPKVVRVSGKDGGQYNSPCPLCGGDDRFISWPEQLPGSGRCHQHGVPGTWRCNSCGEHGDMIAWHMKMEGRTFVEACQTLGIPLEKKDGSPRRGYRPLKQPRQTATAAQASTFVPTTYDAPPAVWREHATKLATEAHEKLLVSPSILSWLAARGLPLDAVRKYRLGYIEGESKPDCIFRNRAAWGLPQIMGDKGKAVLSFRIDRGVSIPVWGPDGQAWRVRVRRRDCDIDKTNPKDPKYRLIPQPGQPYSAPLLLPPSNPDPDLTTWVVVEAELDALAVHWACRGAVGAISIVSATGKPDSVAHKLLRRAAAILVATDFDKDKANGTNPGLDGYRKFWPHIYPQAKYYPVPVGKDPGEAYSLGVNLAEWVAVGSPLVDLAIRNGSKPAVSRPDCSGLSSAGAQRNAGVEDGSLREDVAVAAGGRGIQPPAARRWPLDTSAADFASMKLPPRVCGGELVRMFARRGVDDPEALIMCPRTKPAWWCCYMRDCERPKKACPGHPYCLLDVVRSEIFAAAVGAERVAMQRDGEGNGSD